MTDNRALWELVEKWRSADYIGNSKRTREFLEIGRRHADELAAILERPVVVGDDSCDHNRALSSMSGLCYCTKCFIGMGSPTDYPECSGDPASCPENEGHGCCRNIQPVAWLVVDATGKRFTIYNPNLAAALRTKATEVGSTLLVTDLCELPPSGWMCSLEPGHIGPCAAHDNAPNAALESMVRGKS